MCSGPIIFGRNTAQNRLRAVAQARTGATDGNLSVHLRKLEDAGYVEVEKSFVDRKPQTRARLSAPGRKAWIAYLDQMKALIESG